jgi:predicted  nucleic acid-binding Zn-ribbon protein
MSKKISYTLDLDANLGNLESKLKSLKDQLGSLTQDGKNSALVKSFEQIEKSIDSVRQKTSSPITSQAMFGSLQKDLGKISSSITKLTSHLNTFKNSADGEVLSLLPPNAVQQLN